MMMMCVYPLRVGIATTIIARSRNVRVALLIGTSLYIAIALNIYIEGC